MFDHELLTLRVIGEWWDLDLTGTGKSDAVKALAEALSKIDMQQELDIAILDLLSMLLLLNLS